MRARDRRRDDVGAVAVFVAVMASLLLLMAALAVDLGNGWARKRTAQTQVDVSALSVGHMLPQTATNRDAIVDEVVAYLNRDNNGVPGQGAVTRAQMLNGALGDGEVVFTNGGERMRVVAPPARVDFAFGQLVAEGVDIQAEATVEIRSSVPPGANVLPFAMPDQCPFGPASADTGPGPSNGPDTSGTFTPTNSRNGRITSITPNTAPANTSSLSVAIVLSDLPNQTSSADIEFRVGANTVHTVTKSWTPATSNSDKTRSFSIDVPSQVLANELTWNVWGYVKNKHTENNQTFTVGSGTGSGNTNVSCTTSAHGQYGQMESPRADESRNQQALALNIALGLDHDLYPWVGATAPALCGKKTQSPPSGGIQDKVNPTGNPNCLLPQTGNDGPWMLKGLITGVDGTPGRLNAAANGNTLSGCGTNVTRSGVSINNDRLSCFLKGSYTLNDIAQDTGVSEAMLDADVVDSPRFVWVPIMHAATRDDIDNNTFMGIKRFVPGFITDETRIASRTFSDATADNGVVVSGGNLQSMQVFMFNPNVLPIDLRSPTIDYDPTVGRPVPVLIN